MVEITLNANGVTIEAPEFTRLQRELQATAQQFFAQNPFREIENLVRNLGDIRIEIALNAEQPTTASAAPGQTDLPSITVQVDPNGASAVMPFAMQNLLNFNTLVKSTTQSSRNDILYETLTDAFRILINRHSYDSLIYELEIALVNGGFKRIDSNFRDILKKSIADIIKDCVEYGPMDIPFPTYRTITEEDLLETPDNIVRLVPDSYTKRYFKYSEDKHPGYENWYSKGTDDNVFIKRELGSYYFESIKEEIYGLTTIELAEAFDPYIDEEILTLTVRDINRILSEQEDKIRKRSMDLILGKNSSSSVNLLRQFLGYIASSINLQIQVQLPQSVLNISSITESMNRFSQNMAMVRNLNGILREAIQIPSSIQDLANINLGDISVSLGIGDITAGINFGGLTVGINSQALSRLQIASQQATAELQRSIRTLRSINNLSLEINLS
jgi:hypothetical protein